MRFISGLLRMVLGLGVMGFAAYTYFLHHVALSGDQTVQLTLVGQEISAEPQAIIVGIGAAGLIGLLLFLFGMVTLFRKPAAPAPAGTSPQGPQPPASP
jgi:hypothetical protein